MEDLLKEYEHCLQDITKIKQLTSNNILSNSSINALLLCLGLFHDQKDVNKEAKKVLKKQLDTVLYTAIIDTTKNFTKIKDSYNRGYNYKKALRELLEQYPNIPNIEGSIDLKTLAICLLKASKGSSWEFALKYNIPTKDIWSLSLGINEILEVAVFDQEPEGLWDFNCEKLHFLNYSKDFRLPNDVIKMKLKELQYWVAGDFTEAFYISTLEKLRIVGSRCALPNIPKITSPIQSLSLEISDKDIEKQIDIVTICPNLQELKIDTVNTDKAFRPNWEKILDVVAGLKKLEKLSLESNKIEHLPENISKLTTLRELNLSNNNLTDLPDELKALQSLEVLDISSNKLGTHRYWSNHMPDVVFKLKNLQELKVFHYTTSYTRPAKWESKLNKNIKVIY